MAELARGQNTTIGTGAVTASVTGAKQGTVDLMVFQLGTDGKVRSDTDFVFFNQPASPEGAVRLSPPTASPSTSPQSRPRSNGSRSQSHSTTASPAASHPCPDSEST